jgi:hypothetical protein
MRDIMAGARMELHEILPGGSLRKKEEIVLDEKVQGNGDT